MTVKPGVLNVAPSAVAAGCCRVIGEAPSWSRSLELLGRGDCMDDGAVEQHLRRHQHQAHAPNRLEDRLPLHAPLTTCSARAGQRCTNQSSAPRRPSGRAPQQTTDILSIYEQDEIGQMQHQQAESMLRLTQQLEG